MAQLPLNNRTAVVNPDGTPTQYFIRILQERGITLDDKITAEQALQIVENWAADRDIIAGVGLDGGGPLSSDVTLDLADTAVTPGTYGDGSNVPQITIDQQGRITSATDVPITGGGGGSPFASAHFSVSGGVVTINASTNIASITRIATGIFRVAFTTPPADAFYNISAMARAELFTNNYALGISINRNSSSGYFTWDTTGFDLVTGDGGSIFDPSIVSFTCSTV